MAGNLLLIAMGGRSNPTVTALLSVDRLILQNLQLHGRNLPTQLAPSSTRDVDDATVPKENGNPSQRF